jgi:hypothetical protein
MTQCLENGICGRFGSNFPKTRLCEHYGLLPICPSLGFNRDGPSKHCATSRSFALAALPVNAEG